MLNKKDKRKERNQGKTRSRKTVMFERKTGVKQKKRNNNND